MTAKNENPKNLNEFHRRVKNTDFYTPGRGKKYRIGKVIVYLTAAVYSDARISAAFPKAAAVPVRCLLIAFSCVCVLAEHYADHSPEYRRSFRPLIVTAGMYGAFLLYQLAFLIPCDILYAILKYAAGLNVTHPPFNTLSVILASAAVIGGYVNAHRPVVTRLRMKAGYRSPVRPLRIVQISDLHMGVCVRKKEIRRIVDMVNACHPDLITVTGDIVNHGSAGECGDPDGMAAILREMKAPGGVYSVCGNHDPRPEDPGFIEFLKNCGFTPVDNRCVTVPVPDRGWVTIVGRTGIVSESYDRVPLKVLMRAAKLNADPGRTDRTPQEKSMSLPGSGAGEKTASADRPGGETDKISETGPVIVLDHDPRGITEAAAAGADLVLCGHTHAGQYFPLNLLLRFYYGKKFTYGPAMTGKTWSMVSSGAGYFSAQVRIGTKSEIVCIELN